MCICHTCSELLVGKIIKLFDYGGTMGIGVRKVNATIGASSVLIVVLILSFSLSIEGRAGAQILPITLSSVPVRSLPATIPVETAILRASPKDLWSYLSRQDPANTPRWVPVVAFVLSIALIAIPVWFFNKHVEWNTELKRLNMGLRARTKELTEANESLVAEVSERMRTEQSLEASRRDLRHLTSQLLRVQEEERRRISRDLHDDINQRLALLTIDLEALEKTLATAPIETMRAVRAIEDRVIELSDDVRHLAHQLHPSILDDLGLSIALQRLVDDFTARTGVKGQFIDHDSVKVLDPRVSTCLYRVAQESLRNVSRHAKANQVQVELARLRDGLQLLVNDDGAGFDGAFQLDKHEGLGFLSMKERVTLVGGTLDVQSGEGEGTRVCAWVPLEKSEGA